MAKVTGDFQSDVIRAFKGTLDFYYWRGVGVVRGWPRKPVLPRNPAVQAAGQNFRDNSRAISALPLELQVLTAEEVRDTAYTWKDAWTTTVYGHGLEWAGANDRPAQNPDNEYVMNVDFHSSIDNALATWNVNSAAYIFQGSKSFWVPFDVVPFNKFRVYGTGQSSQAGQTIALAVFFESDHVNPIHAPGPDVTVPNAFGTIDSGLLSVDNIPATAQRLLICAKGSNATVDLQLTRLLVQFVRV